MAYHFNLCPTPLVRLPLTRRSRIHRHKNSLHAQLINHAEQLFRLWPVPIDV
jgi:hypothetical protein